MNPIRQSLYVVLSRSAGYRLNRPWQAQTTHASQRLRLFDLLPQKR
jgi:hypothetical protein